MMLTCTVHKYVVQVRKMHRETALQSWLQHTAKAATGGKVDCTFVNLQLQDDVSQSTKNDDIVASLACLCNC